tara:strand:+ start:472 stop:714 length:243 start_codon:yes stop_codon:yes gene_type:complete
VVVVVERTILRLLKLVDQVVDRLDMFQQILFPALLPQLVKAMLVVMGLSELHKSVEVEVVLAQLDLMELLEEQVEMVVQD